MVYAAVVAVFIGLVRAFFESLGMGNGWYCLRI